MNFPFELYVNFERATRGTYASDALLRPWRRGVLRRVQPRRDAHHYCILGPDFARPGPSFHDDVGERAFGALDRLQHDDP